MQSFDLNQSEILELIRKNKLLSYSNWNIRCLKNGFSQLIRENSPISYRKWKRSCTKNAFSQLIQENSSKISPQLQLIRDTMSQSHSKRTKSLTILTQISVTIQVQNRVIFGPSTLSQAAFQAANSPRSAPLETRLETQQKEPEKHRFGASQALKSANYGFVLELIPNVAGPPFAELDGQNEFIRAGLEQGGARRLKWRDFWPNWVREGHESFTSPWKQFPPQSFPSSSQSPHLFQSVRHP